MVGMSFGVVLLANGVINLRHHSNLLFRNQFVQHLEEDLGKYAGIVIGTMMVLLFHTHMLR